MDWKGAIEDAKECLRLDPSFMKGYYRLATALVEAKDYTSALAAIRQGLSMEASNAPLKKLLHSVQQKQQHLSSVGPGVTNGAASPMASPTIVLDDTTRKELEDLQEQHTETVREHGTVQAQLMSTQRQGKLSQITRSELDSIPDETRCFRSVGKVFLRTWDTKADAMDHLKTKEGELEKQETDLKQKLEYLERRIKSQNQNMEELIASATSGAAKQ